MFLKKLARVSAIICLVLSTLLLTDMKGFALIWCNKSDTCFEDPPGEILSAANVGGSMASYVAEGAGHMLAAHSHTLMFLNRIEVSGIEQVDFNNLTELNSASISSLENARTTWLTVIQKADTMPYNAMTVAKLKSFDYNSFKTERNVKLNNDVYDSAVEYLQNGDTRGLYKKLLTDIDALLIRARAIKDSLEEQRYPVLSKLWELNQLFGNTMLFGQYVAEVFYRIQEN